jgi:hypothetical protein
VAVIETMTFELARGADDAAFVAADKRVQSDVAYQQPGLLRRTTARGQDGAWIVVQLWGSADDADAGAAGRDQDPVYLELISLVDPGSIEVRRYTALD